MEIVFTPIRIHHREFCLLQRFQIDLSIKALFTVEVFRRPKPPSLLGVQISSQLSKCIFLWLSVSLQRKDLHFLSMSSHMFFRSTQDCIT